MHTHVDPVSISSTSGTPLARFDMLQEGHTYRGKLLLAESEGLCSVAATKGRRFVVGNAYGDVHLFEAKSLVQLNGDDNSEHDVNGNLNAVEQLTRCSKPLLHHELGVRNLRMGGPNCDVGACTSLDGSLGVFQLETSEDGLDCARSTAVESLPGESMAVSVCHSMNTCVAVGGHGSIRVIDAVNALVTTTINAPAESGKKVAPIGYACDIDASDEHCAIGFDDGSISIMDLTTTTLIHTNRDIHKGSLKCVRYFDKEIVTSGNDQLIAIADTRTNKKVAEVRGHTGPITGVDWNHNGTLFATTSTDQTVRIWDRRHMKMCFRSRGDHRDAVTDIAYLEDKVGIVSCAEDGSLVLHDQIE